MKKILMFVLTGLVALSVLISCNLTLNDDNENDSTEFAFLVEADETFDGVRIVGYKGTLPNELVIPSEIDGQSVVTIGENTFQNEKITSLEIPDTIMRIYGGAFNECTSLKTLKLLGGVEFWDLHYTSTPTLKNCPIENLYCVGGQFEVDYYPFLKTVKNLTILSGSVGMGEYTKEKMPILETIYFEKDATGTSGEGAFYGCSSLISLVIGDSVTSICSESFCGCISLMSVFIPDSVAMIGCDVFYGCRNLTIYCEAESKPSGWNSNWNYSNCPVVWGYKQEN